MFRTRSRTVHTHGIDKNALRVRHSTTQRREVPMGEARTRSEAYPPLPDPARRPPSGPRGGSLTAATSISGWVQSARKQPESEHTIREMASMLELSAGLLRAE